VTGKIYLDMGGKEGEVILGIAPHMATVLEDAHTVYLDGVRRLRDGLTQKGYTSDTLLYIEDLEAYHNEPAWAKRLPNALRFLLK
ncbi:MAG TPA: hypothetical protein PLZ51_23070, partial [Aggregatilineales bacterium]|nr:hypothetical protein [Aggregatilineales bacterium]